MSTQFRPIQIPPGVVAMPTKKMQSSNWAEVNFMRWRESQLTPMGGQAQYTDVVGGVEQYVFASRCKMIHGWYGLDVASITSPISVRRTSTSTLGGTLTEITPVGRHNARCRRGLERAGLATAFTACR